jgi:hypothetical protein
MMFTYRCEWIFEPLTQAHNRFDFEGGCNLQHREHVSSITSEAHHQNGEERDHLQHCEVQVLCAVM